jgi:hypothetical protein
MTDPTSLELAVMAGKLRDAANRADVEQILASLAALDRMVRSIGPEQAAAADHARNVVAEATAVLESTLERDRMADRIARLSRDGSARAAYVTAAAAR